VSDLFGLQGKKAVVIGGGLGMGRASSRLLGEVGAAVSVVDVDSERAGATAAELRAAGHIALSLTADVQRKDQAERAIEDSLAGLGGLDVMVNVVGGVMTRSPLVDFDLEAWNSTVALNFQQHFYCGAMFARTLERAGHGGAMVSIASIAGLEASPHFAPYGASKAALMALTKTMAVEFGGLGIRVNTIAPGAIETDRSQRAPDKRQRLEGLIPLGRVGNVDDIASTVLFLVSDLSRYITGQTIVVDGGVASNPSF
jgi:2-deoxy-D-gluconate 3-dehydrogenase